MNIVAPNCPIIIRTDDEQLAKTAGEALISAINANDQQQLLDTLYASSKSGLEYLDRFENTPLLVAAYLGRADLVRILLQHGANYKRINLYGNYESASQQTSFLFALSAVCTTLNASASSL